jgi:hypothetical protein
MVGAVFKYKEVMNRPFRMILLLERYLCGFIVAGVFAE